ncbi:MAG: tRNA uridine-5-carboxymethylaminomethyl(34) synthesis GTPase MnmE [Sphingomonadaceae bacterium]
MTHGFADDTIFALSTGQPPAAIAVIRISGRRAREALETLSGSLPEPRHATLAALRDPADGAVLDRALTLFFPAPNSATGEDLAELHLHGGRAVVAAVERALSGIKRLRRAEPGEFTRRAFANGRIDLAEAEGLGDLLTAETEGQRRNAMALADGTLSRAVRRWRAELIDAAAAIEARIDFADEDDVPDGDSGEAREIARLRAEISEMLRAPPAERLRDGIRVVIAGPPNAGKSTLFNLLVGRAAAIATPIAGTTRDLIEYPVQFGGLPFIFIDSAGLRDTEDSVERIGVDRARDAIAAADIILWMGDPDECAFTTAIRLHARADVPDRQIGHPRSDLAISATTGEGVEQLRALLVSRGTSLLPREGEIALSERQRAAMSDCLAALDQVGSDILLQAESLRSARASLDRLTGEGGIEPLLDAIFSRFCIGK